MNSRTAGEMWVATLHRVHLVDLLYDHDGTVLLALTPDRRLRTLCQSGPNARDPIEDVRRSPVRVCGTCWRLWMRDAGPVPAGIDWDAGLTDLLEDHTRHHGEQEPR
jgi:hypothetical protein